MNVYKFGQSEAASYAIVKFLEIESTQEQSSGWMLLTTINLLASLGLEAFINGMTLASLPSTLVKCFYLFFDLPEVKDPDLLEPGSEFTPRERRVLLQKVFVQVSWFSGWKDRGLRAVDVGNRSTFDLSRFSSACAATLLLPKSWFARTIWCCYSLPSPAAAPLTISLGARVRPRSSWRSPGTGWPRTWCSTSMVCKWPFWIACIRRLMMVVGSLQRIACMTTICGI